jgi:hypothetical protein
VAAVFTENAVIVTDSGPIYGREAIEKWATDLFKQIHQVSPHALGNELWCNGEWSQTIQGKDWGPIQQKGYYSAIDSREGDTWNLRMLTFNITPPPAAPVQTK